MLHQQDSSLLLQNPGNPYDIYRVDLEVGKVVEEWKVGEKNFAQGLWASQ
jgi:VID27 C-terminal WD40-like domain